MTGQAGYYPTRILRFIFLSVILPDDDAILWISLLIENQRFMSRDHLIKIPFYDLID